MLPTLGTLYIGQGQLNLLPAKVEEMISYLVSSNKKEIMSFLGMSDYYRKFFKNFSRVCKPFTVLFSKYKEFV